MKYNLANDLDRQRFLARANTLAGKGVLVDLTEKTGRTTNQNAYLHLLIGVVAMETGNTLEDAKRVYFKQLCNPDIFVVRKVDKLGNTIEAVRSSADLTKEEMTRAIDRLHRWAYENGIYLPQPGDEALLQEIEAQLSRMQHYL